MAEQEPHWCLCPIENCEYAQEYDPSAAAFCPDCGMELLAECPTCSAPFITDNQTTCLSCTASFKE